MGSKVGLPPGTLVHVGEKRTPQVDIEIVDYDAESIAVEHYTPERLNVEHLRRLRHRPSVTWIDIVGLHDVELVETLGAIFDIHPLVLEDILHTDQRVKMEEGEEYLFLVLKRFSRATERVGEADASEREERMHELVATEQVSIILGDGFVLSFCERPSALFEPVKERLKRARGRIRRLGSDYLAYALLDAIVDEYFLALETVGERLTRVEEELIAEPEERTLQRIHAMKREMIYLRKAIWPLREVINTIERSESDLVAKGTGIYLRDVYDHTLHVADMIDTYREMLTGLLDLYLSSASNRMNEVMKVLTIIATIFIPLTFVAGVYGMNFNPDASPLNMPELNWYYGYTASIIVMVALAITMLVYFHKKQWL